MKNLTILDGPVITEFGVFKYTNITEEEATTFANKYKFADSYIRNEFLEKAIKPIFLRTELKHADALIKPFHQEIGEEVLVVQEKNGIKIFGILQRCK